MRAEIRGLLARRSLQAGVVILAAVLVFGYRTGGSEAGFGMNAWGLLRFWLQVQAGVVVVVVVTAGGWYTDDARHHFAELMASYPVTSVSLAFRRTGARLAVATLLWTAAALGALLIQRQQTPGGIALYGPSDVLWVGVLALPGIWLVLSLAETVAVWTGSRAGAWAVAIATVLPDVFGRIWSPLLSPLGTGLRVIQAGHFGPFVWARPDGSTFLTQGTPIAGNSPLFGPQLLTPSHLLIVSRLAAVATTYLIVLASAWIYQRRRQAGELLEDTT